MQLISYFIMLYEIIGLIYFYDTFMDFKYPGKRWIFMPTFYVIFVGVVWFTGNLFPPYGQVLKVVIIMALLSVICRLFYHTNIITAIFFSMLNYVLLFFVDGTWVSIFGMEDTLFNRISWIVLRIAWIIMLVILRKKLPHIKRYLMDGRIPWIRFTWFPVFSGMVGIYFYTFFLSNIKPNYFYALISIGIIVMNIMALVFLQDSLIKDEKIHQSDIRLQQKQNQMQVFRDMQSLYDRQGKKLHDYKKQLATMQGLLAHDDIEAATHLIEELTESISVEMSEVNTNHPVVNAILNQEYKIAQGKGIGMIFSVTDADKIILSDEDIVVVLGNLIENAIHECEKVVDEGSNAAIIVKIANVNQKTVITVENPLHNDIIIENNQVVNKNSEGHGIGLDNVRESIERYDGSFAISAENNRFMAVVIV